MEKGYRVDGRDDYLIRYVPQGDGTYKIFAPVCPPDPYDKGSRIHHRYSDGEICVAAGKEPQTLDRAEAIARYWMRGYSTYCHTGAFPDKGGTVSV